MEEEEDSMQGYENIIRDTGPVPESNTTSVNGSDDETETSSVISSKFKVSAASSKVTSRDVSPTRSISNKDEPMEVEEPEKIEVKPKEKHDLSWLSSDSTKKTNDKDGEANEDETKPTTLSSSLRGKRPH